MTEGPGSRVMNKIKLFFDKLWQRGVPVSFIALTLLLGTITVIIVGSGLHSAIIWLILAGVSILFVSLCSCLKCKKSVSRWRRTSEQSDAISTTMETNDFPNMANSFNRTRESITLASDLPPCYTLATFPERPPPPPYTVVAVTDPREEIFLPPSYSSIVHDPVAIGYRCEDLTIPPPPYNSIDSNRVTADNASVCLETRGLHPSVEPDTDSISIISNSDITSVNKNIYEGNVINCQT